MALKTSNKNRVKTNTPPTVDYPTPSMALALLSTVVVGIVFLLLFII